MKSSKKSKHFRKPLKPIPVEAVGLPNNVRIGSKMLRLNMSDQIIKNGK